MPSTAVPTRTMNPREIVDYLVKEGWVGPDLGAWKKAFGGAIWEARTVVFQDGKAGLSVTLVVQ